LLLGLGEAVQDPTTNLAISLLEPLLNQGTNNVIWDNSALINAPLDGLTSRGAPAHLMF
jgi:hypothetical protein